MYKLKYSTQFKRDYKQAQKRGYDLELLRVVIDLLKSGACLPQEYKDHPLTGDRHGFRECHIKPDWLLVYLLDGNSLTLTLTRTGSHSDLF